MDSSNGVESWSAMKIYGTKIFTHSFCFIQILSVINVIHLNIKVNFKKIGKSNSIPDSTVTNYLSSQPCAYITDQK